MRILEVGRYKKEFTHNLLPFVLEQGESLRAAGCEVDYFPVRGNYIKAAFALRAKIKEVKPDIVHAHYGLSGVTAAIAKMFSFSSSFSLVITFHNGEWHRPWVNFLSSLFARVADHLIYVAPHIREKMYIKHPHYTILPCGVNMEESKPTDYQAARTQLGFSPDTFYILFGGAFSNTRKNVALLREAVELVVQRISTSPQAGANAASSHTGVNTAFYAAGGDLTQFCASGGEQFCNLDGKSPSGDTTLTEKADIELAQETDLADNVKASIEDAASGQVFSSKPCASAQSAPSADHIRDIQIIEMRGMDRPTVALYMSACDLFALPTKNEGSPQALKEAMTCNCPIVATDCADIAHLLGADGVCNADATKNGKCSIEGHFMLSNKKPDKSEWVGDSTSVEELRMRLAEAMSLPRGFRTTGRNRIADLGYTNPLVAEKLLEIYQELRTEEERIVD